MGSTRRAFTDEYKAHAVELVVNDGRTIADVARGIEVHEMTLRKWVKKSKDAGQVQDHPLNDNERAELERLREDNKRLRMEVEFSRKVATWFAKNER
jgi:transposase